MVDYKKYNIKDEYEKLQEIEQQCNFRRQELSEELHVVQSFIKSVSKDLIDAHNDYKSSKEALEFEKLKWVFRHGSLLEFKSNCLEYGERIANLNKQMLKHKEDAQKIVEQRKRLEKEIADCAAEEGKYIRMMNFVSRSRRDPLISQNIIEYQERNDIIVMTLLVRVYYKNYDVHQKNDIYYCHNGVWYFDKIDFTKKVSKSRSEALIKLIMEYKNNKGS